MDLGPLIAKAAAATNDVVQGVDASTFGNATPCSEYDVRALAEHVAAFAPASATAARKGTPSPSTFDADGFKASYAMDAADLADAWETPGALKGTTQFGPGEYPAQVAAGITLTELVFHGWDLASATGQKLVVAPEVAEAALAVITKGAERGREAGAYGPQVAVGADRTTFEKALAMSGRDPDWSPDSAT